jgi:pre-mRNA-splicing factor CWC26
VVASERSFKKRRRVGEDGGWISLPPEGQEQAQEVEAEDEKPVVINQDAQPQMTGGLMSHAKLEARFTTTQLVKKAESPTKEQMEGLYWSDNWCQGCSARVKREKEEKEAKRMEWGKGIVQRDEREKARREMELERGKGFERQNEWQQKGLEAYQWSVDEM